MRQTQDAGFAIDCVIAVTDQITVVGQKGRSAA
jgi:hypothetical protein